MESINRLLFGKNSFLNLTSQKEDAEEFKSELRNELKELKFKNDNSVRVVYKSLDVIEISFKRNGLFHPKFTGNLRSYNGGLQLTGTFRISDFVILATLLLVLPVFIACLLWLFEFNVIGSVYELIVFFIFQLFVIFVNVRFMIKMIKQLKKAIKELL
jgi:hypothetical protein